MPRVSEEHLARRRQQILDAAGRCFARKGFYYTSMQDVFAESGLSAGAVYRYFKSKDELVAALAQGASSDIRTMMSAAIFADPLPTPAHIVATLIDWLTAHSGAEGRLRLAPQAWALALVDPQAGEQVKQAMLGIRDMWRAYTERMITAGWLPSDTDSTAVASTLFGVLPGYLLQQLIVGELNADAITRGVEALCGFNRSGQQTVAGLTGPRQDQQQHGG